MTISHFKGTFALFALPPLPCLVSLVKSKVASSCVWFACVGFVGYCSTLYSSVFSVVPLTVHIEARGWDLFIDFTSRCYIYSTCVPVNREAPVPYHQPRSDRPVFRVQNIYQSQAHMCESCVIIRLYMRDQFQSNYVGQQPAEPILQYKPSSSVVLYPGQSRFQYSRSQLFLYTVFQHNTFSAPRVQIPRVKLHITNSQSHRYK